MAAFITYYFLSKYVTCIPVVYRNNFPKSRIEADRRIIDPPQCFFAFMPDLISVAADIVIVAYHIQWFAIRPHAPQKKPCFADGIPRSQQICVTGVFAHYSKYIRFRWIQVNPDPAPYGPDKLTVSAFSVSHQFWSNLFFIFEHLCLESRLNKLLEVWTIRTERNVFILNTHKKTTLGYSKPKRP